MSKERRSSFLGMTPRVVFQHPRAREISCLSKENYFLSLSTVTLHEQKHQAAGALSNSETSLAWLPFGCGSLLSSLSTGVCVLGQPMVGLM